jgi:NADH-quinone oxidoreductase subunit H
MVQQAPLWTALVAGGVLLGLATIAAVGRGMSVAGRAAGAGTPVAEATRLLVQQRRCTLAADRLLWRLGPAAVCVAAALAALVVPLGRWTAWDSPVGVVWFNAMEVVVWAGLWLVGWGANSVWGLVAGYRFLAQGLAYELPHMFALTTVALGAGSLRVGDVVAAQSGLWFVVWMPVAFVAYLIAALAMAFWGPFDAPAQADLAGGLGAELSGVDALLLRAGRYLMLAAAAAFAVPAFLGGGAGPLLPPWLWSLLKTVAVLGFLVWLRDRLPTVRMDRYTELSWLVLLPATLVQALLVAIVVLLR